MSREQPPAAPLRFGLIVPARNESLLLGRKCRNLARLVWPTGPSADRSARHRVVIVDDGSSDGTGALAEELLGRARARCPDVEWLLARGEGRGKARAIRVGLAALGPVDIIVLTDVDVILREASLIALDEAFRADPNLALATGAQEFVRDLHGDGSARGRDGGPVQPAGELFDRVTAKVRAWESRRGRVFSVHGQLLAWRAELGLRPTPGYEADDIDLMCAARRGGGRVELVQGARFLEVKPERGELRRRQMRRRARGYFQILDAWGERHPLGPDWRGRAQWSFYAWAPRIAPVAAAAACGVLGLLAFSLGGWRGLGGLAILLALGLSTPVGRELGGLACVMELARRSAPRVASSAGGDPGLDRWEPPRSTE